MLRYVIPETGDPHHVNHLTYMLIPILTGAAPRAVLRADASARRR